MMYDVPQTDSTSEAAMAALVARFRLSAPKPEAVTPAVQDATLALHLSRAVDKIGSALGDRVTLPLLRWDGALDEVCVMLAALRVYNTRGRNRQAGADGSLDHVDDQEREYLARLRPGGDLGKSENPRFVDSGNGSPRDAVLVVSDARSDDWTRRCLPSRGCC
jgi:hypothetical protein